MSEYWIWNNQTRGWRGQRRGEFVLQLHLAGRFAEHIAGQYVQAANRVVGDSDHPIEVMIEVNDQFLSRAAQKALATYRGVFDDAYLAVRNWANTDGLALNQVLTMKPVMGADHD